MAVRNNVILPGGVLGVLGGGQLGRMFAIAAKQMGYRVHVLVPEEDAPASQVSDWAVVADYDDLSAVAQFARSVEVVTFEFENVTAAACDEAARHAPVRPGGAVLQTTQHRLREKAALRKLGLPTAPWARVHDEHDLAEAVQTIGTPAVLKTASWGYDGKGQAVVREAADAARAWRSLGTSEAIYEGFVEFEREVSVVAVRSLTGAFASYGPIHNDHANHILDVSIYPAGLSEKLSRQAVEMARAVVEGLEVVGVLCVEMFVTADGQLLINELAPRPHNSGHLTIEGCVTSQFEQQVRAVAGLPLGPTDLTQGAAAMSNLLGDLWKQGEPDWANMLARVPQAKLHLYGKGAARPGRKMGHINAAAATPEEARRRVLAAREALGG